MQPDGWLGIHAHFLEIYSIYIFFFFSHLHFQIFDLGVLISFSLLFYVFTIWKSFSKICTHLETVENKANFLGKGDPRSPLKVLTYGRDILQWGFPLVCADAFQGTCHCNIMCPTTFSCVCSWGDFVPATYPCQQHAPFYVSSYGRCDHGMFAWILTFQILAKCQVYLSFNILDRTK